MKSLYLFFLLMVVIPFFCQIVELNRAMKIHRTFTSYTILNDRWWPGFNNHIVYAGDAASEALAEEQRQEYERGQLTADYFAAGISLVTDKILTEIYVIQFGCVLIGVYEVNTGTEDLPHLTYIAYSILFLSDRIPRH